MDLLLKAALSWRDLLDTSYELISLKNQQINYIYISFNKSDFKHLAGFQYLKDLQLPNKSSEKIFEDVVSAKITEGIISKSVNYDIFVKPRLLAISILKDSLENDFKICAFDKRKCRFYNNINADYLIAGASKVGQVFFFTVNTKEKESLYVGCSIFIKDKRRDYILGQKIFPIYRKTKINILTGEKVVLYNKSFGRLN